ncbi:MAG TPA: hypothetical protein VKA53_11555 [Thermoanaerobaculia bacterium]|nr:hypothetical protein [Thermoanaerobaculia bacterium]
MSSQPNEAAAGPPPSGPARSGHRWIATLLAFLFGVAVFAPLEVGAPLLYDNDSYYHLAVAREIARQGIQHDLPQARFSVMAHGFGDKELLFHLLLVPFAAYDAALGGRIALALLDAAILALIAFLSWPAVAWWSLALPPLLALGSMQMDWRLVRLRPELLSLLLLLIGIDLIARGRHRWVGLVAGVYTLAYTAFQALLGLCWLELGFATWVRRKRFSWRLLLYPLLGAGVGLLVHPQFPHNLVVWKIQTFDFFRLKGAFDVGTEILPVTTDVLLMANLGLWLAIAVLVGSTRRVERSGKELDALGRQADAWGVAAAVFGLMSLLASRFVVYFFPFLLLWGAFELARRGRTFSAWLRLPGGRRTPTAAALVLVALVAAPIAGRELARYRARTALGPHQVRLRDRKALGKALSTGARVAAPWGITPVYMFWAPQARYLDVLDPVFMAVPHPEVYQAEHSLFAGTDPDSPLTIATTLDSNYVAFPINGNRSLAERLDGDPRMKPIERGLQRLYEIRPDANKGFLLDWKLLPGSSLAAPAKAPIPAGAPSWPRGSSQPGRSIEGFVDARRVLPRGVPCLALAGELPTAGKQVLELAAWGPTTLWQDGKLLVETGGDHAVLGRGVMFPIAPHDQTIRLTVRTCREPETPRDAPVGFYLLRRPSP